MVFTVKRRFKLKRPRCKNLSIQNPFHKCQNPLVTRTTKYKRTYYLKFVADQTVMYSSIDFLTLLSEGFTVLLLLYVVIWIWILPMNRVRLLCDNVGFAHLSGTAKKRESINRLRKTRFQGKIPPAFPNGWYALAESREVLNENNALVQKANIDVFLLIPKSEIFLVTQGWSSKSERSWAKLCRVSWPGIGKSLCH